jgi:transcriptional regulator with XRE-family HTH domain
MRRMILGVTQQELGRQIGVTFQQVQKYEKGTNRVGASRLQQIARVLRVPVEFLFEGAPQVGTDGGVDAVTSFLSTSDSVELVKAFIRIADQCIRREIIRLARAIADAEAGGKAQPKLIAGSTAVKSSTEEQAIIDR